MIEIDNSSNFTIDEDSLKKYVKQIDYNCIDYKETNKK
jgi:hypothetical protein